MKLANKYTVVTSIIVLIIIFFTIYLNVSSHNKTQEIYLENIEETITSLKKDFIKDNVNNVILEIEELREIKKQESIILTESRLKWLKLELDLSEEEFVSFCINKFNEDIDGQIWTSVLWNGLTGEILYNSSDMNIYSISNNIDSFKDSLSSYGELENGNINVIFGISKSYIDKIVKDKIADKIRLRTFSNGSYIWINEVVNYKGGENYAIRRVHPNLIETEGIYLSTDMEDIKGNKPFLEELEGVKKNGEIFLKYYFKELNRDKISEKITYAKLYEDYDWIIAMGIQMNDIDVTIEKLNIEIKDSSNEYIFKLIVHIFIVLIIGFYLVFLIQKQHLKNSTKYLENEINVDSLSNAFSRRYGEKALSRYFKEYKITGERPAIMIFDIDNFKKVNDEYGHLIGDRVLIKVVEVINSITRSSDEIIRWGGDEFIVILPGLREEHIKELEEKIMRALSCEKIIVEDGYTNIYISMGFSYFENNDSSYNESIKRADDAMYKSKEKNKKCN